MAAIASVSYFQTFGGGITFAFFAVMMVYNYFRSKMMRNKEIFGGIDSLIICYGGRRLRTSIVRD
jgi:hypothetical protein